MTRSETASSQPIVIYPSVWKLLALAVAWIAFGALSVWGTLKGGLICAFMIPVFAWGVFFAVNRVLRRSPVLIIDQDGIYHDVLGLRPHRITWDEIQFIGRYRRLAGRGLFTVTYLAISPHDPEVYLAQQPEKLRGLIRWYMNNTFAPIMVPQHILPVSVVWIVEQLLQRFSPPLEGWQYLHDPELEQKRRNMLARVRRRARRAAGQPPSPQV